jgi:hypothetical protein
MVLPAQQLAAGCFLDEIRPCSGQPCADSESFLSWVYVIEFKILGLIAAGALAAEHLNKTGTPSLPPCLVVATQILGPSRHSAIDQLPTFLSVHGKLKVSGPPLGPVRYCEQIIE